MIWFLLISIPKFLYILLLSLPTLPYLLLPTLTTLHSVPSLSARLPEEGIGGARGQGAVFDFVLVGEVLGVLDGRLHALDSEEGSEVGRVGRDHDECEEPPHASHHACRNSSEGGV